MHKLSFLLAGLATIGLASMAQAAGLEPAAGKEQALSPMHNCLPKGTKVEDTQVRPWQVVPQAQVHMLTNLRQFPQDQLFANQLLFVQNSLHHRFHFNQSGEYFLLLADVWRSEKQARAARGFDLTTGEFLEYFDRLFYRADFIEANAVDDHNAGFWAMQTIAQDLLDPEGTSIDALEAYLASKQAPGQHARVNQGFVSVFCHQPGKSPVPSTVKYDPELDPVDFHKDQQKSTVTKLELENGLRFERVSAGSPNQQQANRQETEQDDLKQVQLELSTRARQLLLTPTSGDMPLLTPEHLVKAKQALTDKQYKKQAFFLAAALPLTPENSTIKDGPTVEAAAAHIPGDLGSLFWKVTLREPFVVESYFSNQGLNLGQPLSFDAQELTTKILKMPQDTRQLIRSGLEQNITTYYNLLGIRYPDGSEIKEPVVDFAEYFLPACGVFGGFDYQEMLQESLRHAGEPGWKELTKHALANVELDYLILHEACQYFSELVPKH